MPQSKSTKKRIRQNEKQRIINKGIKSEIKTRSKNLIAAVREKDLESAKVCHRLLVSKIDKAKKRNVLHKNKAARLESRASQLLQSLQSAG